MCVAGKKRRVGYTEQFLTRFGAPQGSTTVITPTGYMTEDAWVEMAPSTAAGLRQTPIVVDMPHWWMLKVIDGSGPHTSSARAMEIYAEHKILLVKEEGDSSHVNQAYHQVSTHTHAHSVDPSRSQHIPADPSR